MLLIILHVFDSNQIVLYRFGLGWVGSRLDVVFSVLVQEAELVVSLVEFYTIQFSIAIY